MPRFYRYDPLDRLTDVAGHQRFYKQARLATEIQGTVQLSVFQVGDHVLAEAGTGGSNLLATDLQRSVLHTVNLDKTQPIAFSVYGHRPADSGVVSVLGFNGERADSVTGHYLLGNGYRAFNPVLMRFNSPDSWGPFGRGGINSYGYAGGDPINRVDPSGHFWRALKSWLFKSGSKRSLAVQAAPLIARRKSIDQESQLMKDFKVLMPNIYAGLTVASDHKFSRLEVVGHGDFYEHGGKQVGVIASNGQAFTAEELGKALASNGHMKKAKEVHLVMCHSADVASYTGKSFAQELSDYLNVPVTGYRGYVLRRPSSYLLDIVDRTAADPMARYVCVSSMVLDRTALIRQGLSTDLFRPKTFTSG
ncbi:RHS repeat-associated core domain-containing protein [Pseudomonas helleri]|uniref:RHS repeat-associated core domain-containing protein n=1 Tax=Pseudomonas helleri TaxID=1608996 RepID=UPI003816EC96